jgi:Domain of unknown function (DUF4184)
MFLVPFTASHAAAAIPFLRSRLVPSALVIGCMAPDFEYFMRLEAGGGFGHQFIGVFLFDLPVSLIALWLFHAYAKEPIRAWLPENIRRRVRLGPTSIPIRNFGEFALVVFSILVGIATHLLWDSFTHRSSWPYEHMEFLHRTVHLPVWGALEYVRVFQHMSTIAGALVLLLWFRGWYRRTRPIEVETAQPLLKNRRSVLAWICVLSLTLAVLRCVVGDGLPDDRGSAKTFLIDTVVASITLFWVQVVVYGFLRARTRRQLQNA